MKINFPVSDFRSFFVFYECFIIQGVYKVESFPLTHFRKNHKSLNPGSAQAILDVHYALFIDSDTDILDDCLALACQFETSACQFRL